MADWLNHVTIAGPRNATTTHTVDPSTGTAVSGTLFTPTAGRLLVCAVEGSVTSTTPTGWTLPTNGAAVGNTGLYVWYRVAAGGDTFTTTHNGSNYPIVFDFYEFPAGSTFAGSAFAISVARAAGAGPTLSGLTGTNWVAFVGGQGVSATTGAFACSWSAGTELVDTLSLQVTTDGYNYSLAALDASVLTSASSAASFTYTGTSTVERLVFAVTVGAAAAPYPFALLMEPMNRK